MDYVLGSVAALVSGNVTPNRPKILKRALTPTKHQPSPNVTPKSEFTDDRSIFLSPTMQKKKAVVKKSPKRIFQNPDLDITENDGDSTLLSPKADKVKKHLKDDLGDDNSTSLVSKSDQSNTPSKKKLKPEADNSQLSNENTPKKKKKNKPNESQIVTQNTVEIKEKSPKTLKQRRKSLLDTADQTNAALKSPEDAINPEKEKIKRKNEKSKKSKTLQDVSNDSEGANDSNKENSMVLKEKKRKDSKSNATDIEMPTMSDELEGKENKKSKNKHKINLNAITTKDSDSEHESDNEIESENEEINKKLLNTQQEDSSSDEEEHEKPQKVEKKPKQDIPKVSDADEIKRTVFVGNVPFSKKCKKEIKKIFNKHGQIETIRIRTVPIKDARYTPKMALVKNELHPDRSTVNVYIKYADPESVEKALTENNTVLNEHHLRVSRSDCTGAEHDPRLSVFIGNLPFTIEDDVLRAKFEKCGEIVSVRIIRDKKTNAGKGFGYVNFKSKDGVELALNLPEEDLTIKNRILRVKRCTQNPRKGNMKKPHNQRQTFHRQGNENYRQMGSNNWQGGNQRQTDGAYRRVMNKRKSQDANDGPPNKRPKELNQPYKEKKTRKEFVGVTAEKKKKRKFDKGQKKKKALSEILTK